MKQPASAESEKPSDYVPFAPKKKGTMSSASLRGNKLMSKNQPNMEIQVNQDDLLNAAVLLQSTLYDDIPKSPNGLGIEELRQELKIKA